MVSLVCQAKLYLMVREHEHNFSTSAGSPCARVTILIEGLGDDGLSHPWQRVVSTRLKLGQQFAQLMTRMCHIIRKLESGRKRKHLHKQQLEHETHTAMNISQRITSAPLCSWQAAIGARLCLSTGQTGNQPHATTQC